MEITPAVLARTAVDARAMVQHPVVFAAGRVHLDVMDGSLFGEPCVWKPEDVGPLPPGITLELHLMVADPQPVVIAWRAAHAGPLHVIYHAESPRLQPKHLLAARHMGCTCSIALAPSTAPDVLRAYLPLDDVLVMGVYPGASGQAFLGDSVFSTVRRIYALYPGLPVALDGGVTSSLLPRLQQEGVQRSVAFSAIWSHSDPLTAYQHLLY